MHAEPTQADRSKFSSNHRSVKVERVEVSTTVVDMNYSRVELCIDGEEYEFSGPDAQVVGAHLNMAGGGDMFAKGKLDTALITIRQLVLNPGNLTQKQTLALINEVVGDALYDDHPGAIQRAREISRG